MAGVVTAERVRQLLLRFDDEVERLRGGRAPGDTIYRAAAGLLERNGAWLNSTSRVGAVPGINVGSTYSSRAAMVIVGLHKHFEAGIDYKFSFDSHPLATSIVDSGRYRNTYHDMNVLVYIGSGGRLGVDQILERGNLALYNSMIRGTPVRVISKQQNGAFTYKGLWKVTDFKTNRDPGYMVFKFVLVKISRQPININWEVDQVMWRWLPDGSLEAAL